MVSKKNTIMNIKRILFAFIILTSLTSCFEDKGNYEYSFFEDGQVNIEGSATTLVNTPIVITAIMKFSDDDYASTNPALSYKWTLNGEIIPSEVSNIYNFSASTYGAYRVACQITDINAGTRFINGHDIEVESAYKSGFVLFAKKDGKTDIHHVRLEMFPYVYEDGGYTSPDIIEYNDLLLNCYSTENEGRSLDGDPFKLLEIWQFEQSSQLVIMTEAKERNKVYFLNGKSYKHETEIADEFHDEKIPDGFNPIHYVNTPYDSYVVGDNGDVFIRRSRDNKAYHTGDFGFEPLFGKNIKNLFISHYLTSAAIYGVIEEDNGVTNISSIRTGYSTEYQANLWNNQIVPFKYSDDAVKYKPHFEDIKTDVLYSDYDKTYYGRNQVMVSKDKLNNYFIHYFGVASNSGVSRGVRSSNMINVTNLGVVGDVLGVHMLKSGGNYGDDYGLVYFYNATTIFCYDNNDQSVTVVKEFSEKTIVAADFQSSKAIYDSERSADVNLGIAFSDGTFEIWECPIENPKVIGDKIFPNSNAGEGVDFGEIKAVQFKCGDWYDFE